ncbi:MAG: iron-sulfur cluster insertion protein ErpA [Thiotrichales bacterium]|nr:iron-sulfur cluster insertion protein ErpA [Thiotrichales bacterium]
MSDIVLTDNAARKIGELVTKQADPSLMLRVYIEGGGCSGFQYGFELDAESNDDDTVVENAGVKMVVDALSFQYLLGSEVDFKEDLMGARFIVNNPNASTTCGCGASFAI